jgi:hypothetical protein
MDVCVNTEAYHNTYLRTAVFIVNLASCRISPLAYEELARYANAFDTVAGMTQVYVCLPTHQCGVFHDVTWYLLLSNSRVWQILETGFLLFTWHYAVLKEVVLSEESGLIGA